MKAFRQSLKASSEVLKGSLDRWTLTAQLLLLIMSNNKSNHEAELKAAKRAEIERIWFAQEAANKELLEAYKALDIKEKEWLF